MSAVIDTGPRPVEPVAVRRTRTGREVWVDGAWLPASDPRAIAARERPIASHPPGPITRRQGTPDPGALHHAPGIPGIDMTQARIGPYPPKAAAAEPNERACVICGAAFTPSRPNGRPQVTCGTPACRDANQQRTKHLRRDAAVAARRVGRACEHCGTPFVPRASHVRTCSPECSKERHAVLSRERMRRRLGIDPSAYRVGRQEDPMPTADPRPCAVCGRTFTPERSTPGRMPTMCSDECRRAHKNGAKAVARAKAAAFTAQRAAAAMPVIEDHQEPDDPPSEDPRSLVDVTSDAYASEPAPESHPEAPAASDVGPAPRSDEGPESETELAASSGQQVPIGDVIRRQALEVAREAAIEDLVKLRAAVQRAKMVVEYLDGKIADLA